MTGCFFLSANDLACPKMSTTAPNEQERNNKRTEIPVSPTYLLSKVMNTKPFSIYRH